MTNTSEAAQTIVGNGVTGNGALTIAIPTFRDDPSTLISKLMQCSDAQSADLLIYDDGSCDDRLTAELTARIQAWPGRASLVSAKRNGGRSHARNQLLAHADTDWILFLDADMLPDNESFLSSYLKQTIDLSGPALIAGGFSLEQVTPVSSQKLHAAQSRKSECLTARTRSEAPGRYVFTSNILVHRHILETIDFDDGFHGWGWEDVDWGLRVSEAFEVIHIDNTATHLGLDDTGTLLLKYGGSGANFARMVQRHPEAARTMSLTKAARRLASVPGRSLIRGISKATARSALPCAVRLQALKLYRAAAYAEHFK